MQRSITYVFIFSIIAFFTFIKCSSKRSVLDYSKIPSPSENPITAEKVELGRKLFFDNRLSVNNSVSCATCHNPKYAFTDRLKVSQGIEGRKTERNSPSILNSAYLKTVMFDAHLPSLEMQVIVPIQEHTEMGNNMKELIQKLRSIPEYQQAAKKTFNRDFDAYVLTRSISAFERTLLSFNSRFDQYLNGNKNALSADEKAGWSLFSEKLYCIKCHPSPYFTTFESANNGLYKEFGTDKGRFRIFLDSNDIGKFKIPSLRNIELTYPYMHDGSLSSLDEVISHYQKGGSRHQLQSPIIQSFELSPKEREQLRAFLYSLTDTTYMRTMGFR